jgi:hypothetical protein
MWETPIYRIKNDHDPSKEFLIDVTGSAPNFSVPGKQLEKTFDIFFKGLEPSETNVLDFGAAKLRNSIYLLDKGFTVYSCEFNDLFQRTKQSNDFLKKAQEYDNFKQLIFPNDFIDKEIKFHATLLINVLNIMPIQIERLCVLALCREKMVENGRLLWYTQHGAYNEDDAVAKLHDGLVTGKGREYNMFYRDFSRKEIHEMLNFTGFSYNPSVKFPCAGSNQAYFFVADRKILAGKCLGLTELIKSQKKTKNIERNSGVPSQTGGESQSDKKVYQTKIPLRPVKIDKISILEQYSKELSKLSPGKTSAGTYHDLIFNVLTSTFDEFLKNPKKEVKMDGGLKRIDIVFTNKAKDGFFYDLKSRYSIQSPIIFIECKNYSEDLQNSEITQLETRLNPELGMFGIIVCRKIDDPDDLLAKLKAIFNRQKKYIIVLNDQDIQKIIQLKIDNLESKIDDFLEERLLQIMI